MKTMKIASQLLLFLFLHSFYNICQGQNTIARREAISIGKVKSCVMTSIDNKNDYSYTYTNDSLKKYFNQLQIDKMGNLLFEWQSFVIGEEYNGNKCFQNIGIYYNSSNSGSGIIGDKYSLSKGNEQFVFNKTLSQCIIENTNEIKLFIDYDWDQIPIEYLHCITPPINSVQDYINKTKLKFEIDLEVFLDSLIYISKNSDYIFDLEAPLYSEMFKIVKQLSKVLKKAVGSKKIGLAVEGIFIHHAHIHLIPVSKGNDLNPTKAKKGNLKELLKIQKKLEFKLKNNFSN